MKRIGIILFACLMAAMFCGCGVNTAQSKAGAAAKAGEAFQAGNDSYMLSEIVRLPDYDTGDSLGYGVVILMKSDKAPISFSMDSGSSSAKSLISLALEDGSGTEYAYKDVSFSLNEGGDYKGEALFCFTLPADAAFPETGTFTYSGDPVKEIALSFSGMQIPEAAEAPADDTQAAADEPEDSSLAENVVSVTSFEELKSAAQDKAVKAIDIAADIDISDDYTLERSDDLEICVGEGVTLTVSGSFEMVDCTLTNNGFMTISGSFIYGISSFVNSNVLSVASGGSVSCGQSNAVNYGVVSVEQDAEFFIERGTIFDNAGTISNFGLINVRDGGQLNDQGGSVENNGTIDLSSYYNGDITLITGSGTLNDNRE